jgi:protein-S-isoprenylcysteine O-methyltransferase Ste14
MNIYTLLICIFSFTEIMLLVIKRSKTSSSKSQADRWSLALFWISIPVCFAVGRMIARQGIGFPLDSSCKYIGIGVFVIGFIIRWVSVFQLGSMFTVDVSISSTHRLKTNGMYTIVRHPSYLGLMLITAGISLFMCNALSSLVIIVAIFSVTNYRIYVEEKALIAEFNGQYEDYKKRVRKMLPGVY